MRQFRAKNPAEALAKAGSTVRADGGIAGLDERLTEQAARWLRVLHCDPIADRVRVLWNPRLQTTAGTACVHTCSVELNPRLREIGTQQVQRTLRHEVAHLVAHFRAGRRSRNLQTHGPEWRQACRELGIPNEPAFHDLPFQRRTVTRKFAYRCPSCCMVVKRVRKFARYTACYRCCKQFNGGIYDPKFQFQRIELTE